MLLRKLSAQNELRRRLGCLLKQTRFASSATAQPQVAEGTASNLRLAPLKSKLPTRDPFAKNMFLGKFDAEFLAYPETQSSDRYHDFLAWLKPIEDYINSSVDPREIDLTSTIKSEIFEELEKLGVMRAVVDEAYGGMGLNQTEYAKLVETVSVVPILGTYLSKRATVVNLIMKFGSEEQKLNFLPKIANGEISFALCFSENPTGSLADPLTSKAVISECRNYFVLEGRKTWVFDATGADYFLVMAQNVSSDTYAKAESTAIFVVPASAEGIEAGRPRSLLGHRGVDICDVSFRRVKISENAILGTSLEEVELFVSAVGDGKHNYGARAIGLLKRFLNLWTASVRESANFNTKRNHEDSMHGVLGSMASVLYAMEAMVYVTTGIVDNFKEQDAVLEQALADEYCKTACREAIFKGMEALGNYGYETTEPFELVVRDCLALSGQDRSAVDTKIFVSLMGLRHAGLAVAENIEKLRNPTSYPWHALKMFFLTYKHSNLYLEENLHPSLRCSAKMLERAVNALQLCVETLLAHYGILIVNQRLDLARLADMAIDIYAMSAVVSRASRAYCIGLRNCDHDVKVAMIFTYRLYRRIESLGKELQTSDKNTGDELMRDIANAIFEQKKYFAEHPLERTF